MSLSVTALLAAAVEHDPQGIVAIDGGPELTVDEMDRRSQAAAGALLAAGLPFGTAIGVLARPRSGSRRDAACSMAYGGLS